MKRLILTGWGLGSELTRSGLAEIVIPFHFQFAWGPLPPAEKLSAYFAAYTADVFGEIELGYLFEGLALGPRPAVAGLGDELRTIDLQNLRARHQVYLRSRLSLTEFGKAVLAHREDFSRHNPIDRWWGGTHLTNERLWRYGAVLTKP